MNHSFHCNLETDSFSWPQYFLFTIYMGKWSTSDLGIKILCSRNAEMEKKCLSVTVKKNEENVEIFLNLLPNRCIPHPIFCDVGNWGYSYLLPGVSNWSAIEERCYWCMESSVTLPGWYWHQQCCGVFQRSPVLQHHHCLVSVLLRPGTHNILSRYKLE